MKNAHTVAAGDFKARCLRLLDRVARTREPIVVTKRGRPVARVVPIDDPGARPLRGSLRFEGDVVAPLGDVWEADR